MGVFVFGKGCFLFNKDCFKEPDIISRVNTEIKLYLSGNVKFLDQIDQLRTEINQQCQQIVDAFW